MKFADLHIENFLAIGKASVRLDDRGLVLIQGSNEDDTSQDSNGAGKSSIVDALCWCVFGTTARGESGDDIINRTAKKGTRVSTIVHDGAEQYEIARHRKHKTGKNTLTVLRFNASVHPAIWEPLTKGTDKLTQELVLQIIGASYEVFRASIYAGQGQMPDLPAMTDKNLKMLVEEAAGVTALEAAYGLARLAVTTADQAVTKAFVGKNALVVNRGIEDAALTRMQAESTKYEVDRRAMIAAQVAAVNLARVTIVNLEMEKADGESAYKTAKSDVDAIDKALASIKTEQDEERRLESALRTFERGHSIRKTELDRATQDAHKAKQAHDAIDHSIGCPCGECGRPLTATEIAPAKKIAAGNLRALIVVAQVRKKELVSCEQELETAREALEKHRASMTDASAESARRVTRIAVIDAFELRDRSIEAKTAQIKEMARRARDIAATPNPHETLIKGTTERIAKLDAEIATQTAALEKLEQEKAVKEAVAQVFSPTGVRAHILDTVTPFLNDRTAIYLGTLSDGNISAIWSTLTQNAKGEWRERFAIDVSSVTGGSKFGLISGGEQRKVRIACALALQDLVASRASKPIELFVGDEIDDALDVAGKERLMQVLVEKAKERGSVFIISHGDLKSWISQCLVVTKRGGYAEIEEVTV